MSKKRHLNSDKAGFGSTVFGFPYGLERQQDNPSSAQDALAEGAADSEERSEFKIRLARDALRLESASILIRRRYEWRGYKTDGAVKPRSDFITLVASIANASVATVSVGLDFGGGLLAEELYPDEVQVLRGRGYRLCEFVKLAVDTNSRSNAILGAIFHVAVIYAKRIHNRSHVLVEVNPRHAKFYEVLLGLKVIGEARTNSRVNAPAVLMLLDLEYAGEQISMFRSRSTLRRRERSIYTFAFSEEEEESIYRRLIGTMQLQPQQPT
ncbi:MAG TPA: long-chain N-acyl amino acid synthase [Ideonella sp.]|uniref:N-acyl amino acid synthase FeeM domain-containing protein n=1 Tax=Ideonella sp. TaxID=1929293 RepID=UPI002E2F6154|nr:long-chain N-acyl amino acid synthase [Ideonella sp.]HEX5682769.1 long-chain N-acyl amino acid synthase [Ideonella sp.]